MMRMVRRWMAARPRWVRIGIAVDAVLLVGVAVVVAHLLGGSSTVAPLRALPMPSTAPSTAPSTTIRAAAPATTAPRASTTAAVGAPATTVTTAGDAERCADPDDCIPAFTGRPGMREPDDDEDDAIKADIGYVVNQPVNAIAVSVSDATWAVANLAPGPGGGWSYVVVHRDADRWTSVVSGYPDIPCDRAVPAGVRHDFASLMAC